MATSEFYTPVKPEFMGAPAPEKSYISNYEYFGNYRNEVLSRFQPSRYEWGGMDIPYTAIPRGKIDNKFLKLPLPEFSMLDKGRQTEVENFYIACQYHRDQYMDSSGIYQPLDYFKPPVYNYQCPTDPTSNYFKYPDMYVEYKKPSVLPLTLERSYRSPLLPQRALTGVYNQTSDISYKR